MKTTLRLASLLLPLAAFLTGAPAVLADETDPATDASFKPKEYDVSRYSKNFEKKSPFEFDPPPPEVVETVNNFEGVSLGGYCGNGNTLSVYLIVGKEKKRVTVYGDGSPFKKLDNSGFRILTIKRGKSLTSTTVLLEKGGQQKEIGFEKETLLAKAGGAGAQQQQQQMVIGPDGRPVQRAPVPRPAGGMPTQAYQAPAPFIPGQANNNMQNNGGAQNNPALQNLALQQQMAAQQQANQLLNTPNLPQAPGGNPVPGQNGAPLNPQRRRVVLPTQNP